MKSLFLSRSAIETYQTCQQKYQWEYLAFDHGIVPAIPNRALEIGNAIHMGMEMLMQLNSHGEEDLLAKIWIAIDGHLNKTFIAYVNTVEKEWTLKKDIVLAYSLVRAFAIHALPEWKVVPWFIERDTSVNWTTNGYFESKADYIGWNEEEKRFKLYNWKSAKYHPMDDGRADKKFKNDLQGITESYCIENAIANDTESLEQGIKTLNNPPLVAREKLVQIQKMQSQVVKRMKEFKIDSVSYVFFIKGMEIEEKDFNDAPTGRIISYSPLIRGWRSRAGGGYIYAWTNKVVKEENKSGFGYLGKGWEEFNVWEAEELGETPRVRIDRWEDMLKAGLQEEMGNPLSQSICITSEKFRSDNDTQFTWLVEVYSIMREIEQKIINKEVFRRTRSACSYPSQCPYTEGCFRGLSAEDMIRSGEFKEREPHHKMEKEYLDEVKENLNGSKDKEIFPKY